MQKKRNITIDDLFQIKIISTPEISADGQKIVFVYKWVDLKTNSYYSNLYMANLSEGTVTPFTHGDHQDSGPTWSPDDKYILFRSDREKKKGLWLIPSNGGEAYLLLTDKGTIGDYAWAPDSKHIAYTLRSPDPPVPALHLNNDPNYVRKDEDENPYDIIENLPYKTKGGYVYPKGKYHIYLLDIGTGNKVQLTNEDYHDSNLCFSPDGKQLAFCSNRVEDSLHNYENLDIYLLDLNSKELRKITQVWGNRAGLCWSEDSKYIFFTGHHAPKGQGGYVDLQIYKIPVTGGEEILITQNFKGFVSNLLIGDAREFEDIIQPPLILPGGKKLLFCASYEGGCYMFEVSTDGGEPKRLENGEHEIVYYSMDGYSRHMAILKGDMLSPSEIYLYKRTKDGWRSKQVTFCNKFLEQTTISRPQELWFTNSEGVRLQGWLLKPPDFDPTRKYPLIHEIHGGPHILYGYTFFHEMQYYAAKGYCVLFINPRGSRGYGTEFTKAVEGNWGGPDSLDQMEFLDHVLGLGFIDPAKLFITGGSYGGFMTNWLVTRTHRYCAAASHRSVSNLISAFGVSAGCIYFERTFGGLPWKDYEHYQAHSPLYHVEKVTTPILLMQSENDHLTPTGEAEQFFVALRYLGKRVRFVRFKNETHELSRSGKPTNRRARLELVMDWFDSFCRGGA